MGAFTRGIFSLLFPVHILIAQINSVPFVERFDSVQAPALPPGWETSTNRTSTGDFFSTATSARSAPFAVQSTNSTIAQFLISPVFDFSSVIPDELQFYIARSGTHTSDLLIETTLDGGNTWPLLPGDTLTNSGTTGYARTTLQLPDTLSNHFCRFRWRILGGKGGTTGTFRIDDISVTVQTPYDLAAARLSVLPEFPASSDQISLTLIVKSLGVLTSSQYVVEFFLDVDNDGVADLSEQFASAVGLPITPGDSLQIQATHAPLPPGTYRFLSVVRQSEDGNPANDTASVVTDVGVDPGSIVVNEIMYAPGGDEPEWVEFLNISDVPVNLKNWTISDNRTSLRSRVSSGNLIVQPAGFVLIAKDTTVHSSYDTIPAPVSISNFSALNNTSPDAVVLFDTRSITIDSVAYDPLWGGNDGRSLERIDPLGPSNSISNWISSVSPAHGTPGRTNTVVMKDVDVRFETVTASGTTILIQVLNAGRLPVLSFEVDLSSNFNGSEIAAGTIPFSGILARGESVFLSFNWLDAPPGRTAVLLLIDLPGDQRPENNTDTVFVVRQFKLNDVVINEIMFEPLSGQNEWLELVNRTERTIDLAGWQIRDLPAPSGSTNRFTIGGSNGLLGPGGFKVLAAESTFHALFPNADTSSVILFRQAGGFSFGNDGDAVILTDLSGALIDSLAYSPSWHHPKIRDTRGRSLERIRPDLGTNDPRNWSTSADPAGGSPGIRNSIFTAGVSSTSSLSFSPNPFSPDGDGYEDHCAVRFNIPDPVSVVRIGIYDLGGRLIRMLADGEPFGTQGEVVWDGMESGRRKARIGPHIVLLEAIGADGSVFSARGVVVVAARLD